MEVLKGTQQPLDKFFGMHRRMQAFSLRDLQAIGVIFHWGRKCGFTLEDVEWFVALAPAFTELEMQGYFNQYHSPEQSKVLRRIEMRLPRDIRRELRKARLKNLRYGGLGGKDG